MTALQTLFAFERSRATVPRSPPAVAARKRLARLHLGNRRQSSPRSLTPLTRQQLGRSVIGC